MYSSGYESKRDMTNQREKRTKCRLQLTGSGHMINVETALLSCEKSKEITESWEEKMGYRIRGRREEEERLIFFRHKYYPGTLRDVRQVKN